MASFYWFKLYHEILDDPKMSTLSDRLWRRSIELMAVASKTRRSTHEGRLPPLEQIAWHLRLPAEEVEADLVEIANRTGIVELRNGHWFVTNFADRQAALSSTDRSRYHRAERGDSEAARRRYLGGELSDPPDLREGNEPATVGQRLRNVTAHRGEEEEDARSSRS